jgi:lipopolysaccharide cholinephosphotransferase
LFRSVSKIRGPATGPVDAEGLAQVLDLLRPMLHELDRIARSEGVEYFLGYGTAIGAVREGDLIPWDTDIDLFVPTRDYSRLCAALSRELPARYQLHEPGPDSPYEYLFARVGLAGVDHTLVHLDLFRLAPGPDGRLASRTYTLLARALAQAYALKQMDPATRLHYGWRKKVVARASRAALRFVPRGWLLEAFRRLEGAWAGRDTGTLVSSCGSYGEREFFRSEWFSASKAVPFAGGTFPVPIGVDPLLTHQYGDYMEPIPAEDQTRALRFATLYNVAPLREQGVIE